MNKVKENFVRGTSENLPFVDLEMLSTFILNNECFFGAEMRNVKTERSMRPNYGDSAIGYVQVLRKENICTIEAKVCPEHRIRNKNYTARVIINEKNNVVMSATCDDCAASLGGCKHAVALLAWIYRRSEEPAPTSVECYWKKPKLSEIGTKIKYLKISEVTLPASIDQNVQNKNQQNTFIDRVLKVGKVDNKSHLIKFFDNSSLLQGMSMHHNSVLFNGDKQNVKEFLDFVAEKLTTKACSTACSHTLDQSDNHSWYELRYGRVTASVIYEAAQCVTSEGSLVEKILSAQHFDTVAMKRGRKLEPQVLQKVANRLKIKVHRCGLLLSPKFPQFGASPDGFCNDAVVEVKCPISSETVKNYYCDGKIKNKCKAQIQLQMLFHEKQKGYLCIADPKFEENGNVVIVSEDFDRNFITAVIKKASIFWSKEIFPKLMQ